MKKKKESLTEVDENQSTKIKSGKDINIETCTNLSTVFGQLFRKATRSPQTTQVNRLDPDVLKVTEVLIPPLREYTRMLNKFCEALTNVSAQIKDSAELSKRLCKVAEEIAAMGRQYSEVSNSLRGLLESIASTTCEPEDGLSDLTDKKFRKFQN